MPPRESYLPPIQATPEEVAQGLFYKTKPKSEVLARARKGRNAQWENNGYIPSWVNPSEVDLDRFFTNPAVAEKCYEYLIEVMETDHADAGDYKFVEPSAGQGSFYSLLPADRRIGIDLVPDNLEYVIADYLSWKPQINGCSYAVVGNPPFGYRGWLALAFVNHSATFADYIGMILPMSFQSEGKGSPKHRVVGAELVQSKLLPNDAFVNEDGQSVKINALWQVWRRGVNNRPPVRTCSSWVDLFTVDVREERLCGHERLHEADWFLQRTFYGDPPSLVKRLEDVKYGCGYGIVIKQKKKTITEMLNKVDWKKYSNLAMHNCRHISMYHIENALIDAGFADA